MYVKSDVPLNALGHKQPTTTFREGDVRVEQIPRKVLQVLLYPSQQTPYRYIVSGKDNVSFTEFELFPANETETEEKHVVEKILDKKKIRNKIFYLIKWKNQLTKTATWEPATTLREYIPLLIDQYENNIDKSKKKKRRR